LAINGTFSEIGSATHNITGDLTINAPGLYDLNVHDVTVNISGHFINNGGTAILGSGTVSVVNDLTNSAMGTGTITSTSGNLRVGGNVTNVGSFVHNNGTLILNNSGNTTFTPGASAYSKITQSATGVSTLAGGEVLSIEGTLHANSGTFSASAGGNTINTAAIVVDSGTLTLTGGSPLTVSGDLTINSGTLTTGCSPVKVSGSLTNSGTYTLGTGTVTVDNFVNTGAVNAVANTRLNVNGNFTDTGTYNAGAPTTLDLRGTDAIITGGISTYDDVIISGSVTLADDSTFSVGGDLTNNGTLTGGSDSILRFNGTGAQTFSTTALANASVSLAHITTNNTTRVTFNSNISINETFTIAGGATVTDSTPGSVYNFGDTAEVIVSGVWNLTGGPSHRLQLLGTGTGPRWKLRLNSTGVVVIDQVEVRDSELILAGESMNGKNIGNSVVSLGNLSDSWGPFDPAPAPYAHSISPSSASPGTISLQITLTGGNLSKDTTVSFGEGISMVSLDASDAPATLVATINVAASAKLGARHIKVTNPDGEHTTKLNAFTVSIPDDGFPVTPVTLPGDANDDGIVNLADFSILAATFGTADLRADFNSDGFVTLADFNILATNFGKAVSVSAAPVAMREQSFSFVTGEKGLPSLLVYTRYKQSFRTPVSHSAGRLSLCMPDKQPRRGDVVEVAVMAEDASLKAYSFELGYDAKMLQLLKGGIAEGDFLKDTLFVAKEDGLVFSATRSGASEGTGVLTKLRFRLVAEGVARSVVPLWRQRRYDAITLRDVQIVDGSGRFSRLPELHATLRPAPHNTRLLANYPNPFNPETWIPFELAFDAKVKVQIYDVSGRLVRTLDLGHRPAGHYVDGSAAACWDGRNFSGERVASGVYLYRLTAGDFSAMRKMLVLK